MSPRVATFALLMATALAAAPSQTPQRPPVFRAGVDLTHLDVTVLDRQRRPVRGLTAADFTIGMSDGSTCILARSGKALTVACIDTSCMSQR